MEELLVKGGYLNPDEALASDLVHPSQSEQMQRASQIFHSHVQTFNSDFISPQYDRLYAASQPDSTKVETVLP